MRPLAALVFALLLQGCASLVPPPQTAPPAAEAGAAWSRVLDRFVDAQGRVDFARLARERADLDRYVAWVYANGPRNRADLFLDRARVLAFHINAYNALAMYSVLAADVPRSLAEYGLLHFFWVRKVAIGGEAMSLYRYENAVIRRLGEERAHFALNCMAAACPRLPRSPFRAETLEADLEREARAFFAEARNVEVDHARRVVRLSEILDFYRDEFLAKAPTLLAYVNRHRVQPVPQDYRVEFIPYDWSVAARPPG